MSSIDLTVRSKIRSRNIVRCRERGIVLPTYAQMKDPARIHPKVRQRLPQVGLWDVDPLNLFRIGWHNDPKDRRGQFGPVNVIELPPVFSGTPARILALVGRWFPTGAHKVGATYGCLAPALVTGRFDSTTQKAAWPSTGNYCRGGAYNSALLGCESIAILPAGMSKERFSWLEGIAGEVITTPGSESNVKEIFDKCRELVDERGDDIVVFNQFEEFGNYLWHYEVTGNALLEALLEAKETGQKARGFISSTGSAGTIAAGDFLKSSIPDLKIAAVEALQCPTLLRNGFGAHRIEGIGDKHVPWIHNVKNTDMILAVDDEDCVRLVRLFNEPIGREFLIDSGVPATLVENLPLIGISGVNNILASIKFAKYFELTKDDIVLTVLADSMELYGSRIEELRHERGAFTINDAVAAFSSSLIGQRIDNVLELGYYDKKRIHNLKYFTWVEQQNRSVEELNAQWYAPEYWANTQTMAKRIDELIDSFNTEAGVTY